MKVDIKQITPDLDLGNAMDEVSVETEADIVEQAGAEPEHATEEPVVKEEEPVVEKEEPVVEKDPVVEEEPVHESIVEEPAVEEEPVTAPAPNPAPDPRPAEVPKSMRSNAENKKKSRRQDEKVIKKAKKKGELKSGVDMVPDNLMAALAIDPEDRKRKPIIGLMQERAFGPLLPFINDPNVTDINWNGKQLWIDDVVRGRYLSDVVLTPEFVNVFSIRVSNVVSRSFNKYQPELEAETDELRITVIHESKNASGRVISIRKTPAIRRISFKESILEGGYMPLKAANLLSNCVKAKMNVIVVGLTGVGKTELVKYLTNYIFPSDRAITIEDTYELHYSQINPGKDCLEFKVDERIFNYPDAIKASLRLVPEWVLLSEARGSEVRYLIESVSTGSKCITTMHTDNVRKIPDRILNMINSSGSEYNIINEKTTLNQIFSFFDVGVLVERFKGKDDVIERRVTQIGFFDHSITGENTCSIVMEDDKMLDAPIQDGLLGRFKKAGIKDPYTYTFLNRG